MIGLFDSGHGGLTVWQALRHHFPEQSWIYLGDHGHAPYGSRTVADILNLTRQHVEILFNQGCRLVILACNTASAIALRKLQQEWLPVSFPDRRILGVIVPTVEAVTGQPWHHTRPSQGTAQTVGVFATPITVASEAFPQEIHKRSPHIRVAQQACPDLVAHIENGAPDDTLKSLIQDYVQALLDHIKGHPLDSVLLGCTHYPLVAHHFKEALPSTTRLLSQPELVAQSLDAYLKRHPQFQDRLSHPGTTVFLTTGDAQRVSQGASRFLGQPIMFQEVRERV